MNSHTRKHTHTHTHAHTHANTHTHTHTLKHTHTHTRARARTHARTHARAHTHGTSRLHIRSCFPFRGEQEFMFSQDALSSSREFRVERKDLNVEPRHCKLFPIKRGTCASLCPAENWKSFLETLAELHN